MTRSIGLVLGAGGGPGWSYLVGTMAAVQAVTGWDPRSADLVVGTSAGAGVGAQLRAGLSAPDQFATQVGDPLSPEGETIVGRAAAVQRPESESSEGRSQRPASPGLIVRSLAAWPPRPGLLLAGARPRGTHSNKPLGDRVAALAGRKWPTAPYWAVAVRQRDGRRVVFGRDDVKTDIGSAVRASSAVPGWFEPMSVNGIDYVDGGVWSATNADLAAGLGFDAVVVVAPLSNAAGLTAHISGNAVRRAYHRRCLATEAALIRHGGSAVYVIEPDATMVARLQAVPRDGSRRGETTEAAFSAGVRRLEGDPELAKLLADLAETTPPGPT